MPHSNKTTLVFDDRSPDRSEAEKLAGLDYERQALSIRTGRQEETYGIWGPIWRMLAALDRSKGSHRFHKKTYLWLMLVTGWLGGHRYYQGRWKLGLLYTLFCWTGIPLALCVTDFMEVFPIKADDDGCVVM